MARPSLKVKSRMRCSMPRFASPVARACESVDEDGLYVRCLAHEAGH